MLVKHVRLRIADRATDRRSIIRGAKIHRAGGGYNGTLGWTIVIRKQEWQLAWGRAAICHRRSAMRAVKNAPANRER